MRLIDAEVFLKTENDRCGSAPLVGTCTSDNQYLSDRLKKAPTIEAKPVVHGRWETNSDRPDSLICSVCKCGFDMWKHDPHNYCPSCGAKMDEPAEESKP